MPSQIQEAIAAAANVTPLIQKRIDPMLLEYQRRYSPLLRTLPSQQWDSSTYYFNQRNSRPTGGFVTDGGARTQTSSVYAQNAFNIRLLQAVGGVTGYAQAVTRGQIGDLLAREIDGAVQSLLWDIETAILWGWDAATLGGNFPEFNGLDALVNTYSGVNQNSLDKAKAAFTLAMLDQIIDNVEANAAMPIEGNQTYAFIMSPTANSKIAQLETSLQRFNDRVEVAPGLTVMSYRGIPIIKSSFLAPRSNVMGTVAASASGSGTLGAGTYNYRVAPVISRFGEIQASVSVAQAASGSNAVNLTVAAPANMPDGAGVMTYKVYRSAAGGGAGTETLLGVVDAFDNSGSSLSPNPTTTIIDNGTALLTNSLGATNSGAATYVGTNAGQSPKDAGCEDIFLVPIDPNFLVRPFVRNITPLNVAPTITAPDTLPFALATDTCLAVRGPKYVGRLSRVISTL